MNKEELSVRFQQCIDCLKKKGKVHKQQDIADAMGISKSRMSDAIRDRGGKLSIDFLQRFARAYSEYINEEWLLTGEGLMEKPDKSMRPHFDTYASAGFMDGISEGKTSAEFRNLAIPSLFYDFSIDASGDSMLPSIENGDTLLCSISDDRLNPPINKICVIDTCDGALVKQIKKADDEVLTLHSLNPRYPDRRIDTSSINRIAEVVGLIRTFKK